MTDAAQVRDGMLALLNDEAQRVGDAVERAARAARLSAELAQLTVTDEGDRALVEEASRFQEAIAASQAAPAAAAGDLRAEARELTDAIQRAAVALHEGSLSAGDAAARGQGFATSIKDLLGRALLADRQGEIAEALQDADLDVMYLTTGGHAPISLSLRSRLS